MSQTRTEVSLLYDFIYRDPAAVNRVTRFYRPTKPFISTFYFFPTGGSINFTDNVFLLTKTPFMAQSSSPGLSTAIIRAGLIAGTLDGTAAIIQYTINGGKQPANIFRYIASGLFGKKALAGGWPMAGWGLLFHFLIAFAFTLFFFRIYPRVPWFAKNKLLTGLVYGVFVWAVMNLLVVPLSYISKFPAHIKPAAIAMMILVVCIGMPLSLLANKYYLYKNKYPDVIAEPTKQ